MPNESLIEEVPGGKDGPVMEAAHKYWQYVLGVEKVDNDSFRVAVHLGDVLLKAAGHWTIACQALRADWFNTQGSHLQGVFKPCFDQLVATELLQFSCPSGGRRV